MPSKTRALLELTRIHLFPVGSELVFWPFAWGFLLAAYHEALPMNKVPVFQMTCLTAILIAKLIERTKDRPLVSGAVTKTEASILLAVIVVAILYVGSSVGTTAFILGVAGLPISGVYPLMKRWVYWPSLFLGLASSWAVPVSWVATTDKFHWGIILNVAIASCCWACIYDIIYACQDKKHDVKAGVKSMAVHLGKGIRLTLSLFSMTCFICLLWAGYLNGQRLPFYVISVIAPFILCLWHIWSFDDNDPQDSLKKFMENRYGATMICTGLLVDHYFKLAYLVG